MSYLGSSERPLRVAIVGAGPSGFYAADALTKSNLTTHIDIFERLPTPYGLVRYGVAPDHQKIKGVTAIFDKIAAKENVSFLGNVEISKDITVDELKKFYDAIIFACGTETDRKLRIPGIDLEGSHTATEFVAWYNGHPDYRDRKFDLSKEVAVVIGMGNVAIDVARILSKTPEELKKTDITEHALEALSKSKINEIHLIGRRGPMQAACTPSELRELAELEDCQVSVNPVSLWLAEASLKELEDPKNIQKKKNFEAFQKFTTHVFRNKKKVLFIHFMKNPVRIEGEDRVKKIFLEKTELVGEAGAQKARGRGIIGEVSCDLVFRSVGYSGIAMEGVPFDENNGVFANVDGRIVENNQPVEGLYVTGWIKRGPSGVVGTNKADSDATVRNLLDDVPSLKGCETPCTEEVKKLIASKGKRIISFDDWKKIDAEEIKRGEIVGKPREKFVTIGEMIKVLD